MSMPVAQGNPCRVMMMKAEPETAPQPSHVTQCCTWLGENGVPQVRCWTPMGQPISLCGHGLLSCGTIWTQRGEVVSRMIMNDANVRFSRHRDISWVGFDPIASEPSVVPEWVKNVFGSAPQSAAVAGGEAGYLILCWPDSADLRDLTVPGAELAEHTGRAIIATCADTQSPALDIRQRYFAPQHGIAEDIATGSAMRVLADFWQAQGGYNELRAWQCSVEGGHLFSRIEGGITWVGGRVEAEGV
ncbi:PhzF family phenazine biosynthesis protein [Halioglobus sp. Uisw_031]|uniref:PhzF family phenazine biosynthesis protein n=1 Tax=Halioglobus sp. Uisw_031 TaxID=3230977 RepID=UPI0039EA7B53